MKWEEITIGEVCKVGRGSSPRPINNQAYFDGGQIPWIKIADATASGKVLYETKEHVNSYGASFSRLLPGGSLILATSGVSLGQVKFLGMDGCIHDGWLYLDDFKNFDRGFMYYILIGLTGYFHSQSSGAAIQNINTDILRDTKIPLPPLPIQQKIAAILSAYDDLIENNLRRIRLLEEAAQHLYREWFVEFRFPGWEGVEVVDGLPVGWERKTFFDVAEVMSGGTPKTDRKDYWDGEIPFFTPKDGSGNASIYINQTERRITEDGLKNCNSRLYPKNTVFITARGTVGRICLSAAPMAMSQSSFALSGKGGIGPFFLCSALQNSVNQIKKYAVGGVFDTIIVDTFKKIECFKPTKELVVYFEQVVTPNFSQIENLYLQNQKLKAARDLLLPRLMDQTIEV